MATETGQSRAGLEEPVMKPEDDRYGFTGIADGLARSISVLDENISTVIGIEGKWGSGKTSLMYLLTDQLKSRVSQNTQIVLFSPWIISPDASSVTSLLLTIAARLAKLDTSAQAQASKIPPLTQNILNYAQQTSRRLAPLTRFAGNFIPGLGLAADAMDAMADTNLSWREKTAAELRSQIEEKIADLGVSFIVVIDDLDRLEPTQAVEILRMVRSVADFSRIRYVMCYDRDVLAHAVERGLGVQDGQLYLQKIIPLSFSLPRPESFELRREFREGALAMWHEVNDGEPDEEMLQLLAHYIAVYGEALTTPREVKQVLNAIRFRYPGLRDYVFFPDLCLLQLLSTVNPRLSAWVEHYLTVWSVVENHDGSASDEEQKAMTEELTQALKIFGVSRACSVWELHDWLPGIAGFGAEHLRLFEPVSRAGADQARQQRRLRSSVYWRYYFSFSAPQNVMSDADIQAILVLAASDYTVLEKRLLNSVTTNGVSSRTWFEHILTRLTITVTDKAGTRAQRNLLKFFFRCSDQILPFYRKRDIFFRQENTGIDAVVTQLLQQLLNSRRRDAITFICRCFRHARAFVWTTVYMRSILVRIDQDDAIFTRDETTRLHQMLSARLQDKVIQRQLPDVPYLATFLYAWRDIASEATVGQWMSGMTLSDREFLQMLLNLRTAVSSSNLGNYLRLDLDTLSTVFGISGLHERLAEIKAKKASALLRMVEEVEEAIWFNSANN